jgi:hypothetical protein
LLLGALALHAARGLANAGTVQQFCLDGLELDAIAAQLDLRIDATVTEERAVRSAMR